MNCENFQKLKWIAKQNPEKFDGITKRELDQWVCQKEEVTKDDVTDNGIAYGMLNWILCI